MKLADFLDFILSGAFALLAFLFYLMNKYNVKKHRKEGMHESITKMQTFRSWLVVYSLIVFCLVYFFSFIKSL